MNKTNPLQQPSIIKRQLIDDIGAMITGLTHMSMMIRSAQDTEDLDMQYADITGHIGHASGIMERTDESMKTICATMSPATLNDNPDPTDSAEYANWGAHG